MGSAYWAEDEGEFPGPLAPNTENAAGRYLLDNWLWALAHLFPPLGVEFVLSGVNILRELHHYPPCVTLSSVDDIKRAFQSFSAPRKTFPLGDPARSVMRS